MQSLMGQLYLMDDNVTREELLQQVSHKFTPTATNKKGRFLGQKQVNIQRKLKTASLMSSPKTDSQMSEIPSSFTYQTSASTNQLSQRTTGFRCGKEVVQKMPIDNDEKPGTSRQAWQSTVNRKRTTTGVIEDNCQKNNPKRARKDSCELLKDELRRGLSNVYVAESITYSDFEITDNVIVIEEEYIEQSHISRDGTPPSYTPGHRKHINEPKVGLNYIQDSNSDASDCKNSYAYNRCTLRPKSGKKKAKKGKQSRRVEIFNVDDSTSSSTSHFEKTDEVRKCNGTEKLEDSWCSSSESGVSESRTPSSEWIVQDKDSSFCFKRIFDAHGESAVVHAELESDACERDQVSRPTCSTIGLPAITDIPDWMYVAIDCEMVGVGPNGKKSVLARCSIVDYHGSVLYDKYIKPSEVITDYRTPWSGIRPIHMQTAAPRDQALRDIRECLAHKVVIGHAVYHDFKVLGITPDHHFVRDTAQCAQLVEMAQLQGKGNSLKKLSEALLDRQIQVGRQGHCSVEDARATLDLFKLVRPSWERTLYVKWSQKDKNISSKMARFVDTATQLRNINPAENFLDDIFWPSHITN